MPVDDELIDRILTGEASDKEIAQIQEWLKDPLHLEQFALRAELHADLRRSLQRRHIQTAALKTSPNASVVATASTQKKEPTSFFRRQQTLILSVAGLMLAVCILFTRLHFVGQNLPSTTETLAARVVNNVNGVLTKDNQKWNSNKLFAGDYELQKGLLHLQFGGGVMVYVEAPARFQAVSGERVVLHSGRLSAKVPPEGIGFTVETPEAEVVDFGTEFSVDVEGGASEVHVFDGLVRVHPGTSDQRDDSKSVDLQASQALRITEGLKEPEDISIAKDRFIRNFDEPRLNYARAVKRLMPVAFYRMPIRDRGLVAEPPEYSGIVLTGQGKRPPHARGVFVGGSLRVGVDSVGKGGRVDSPPPLNTGQFSLSVFVYLETPVQNAIIATNRMGERGNFKLSVDQNGMLHAAIMGKDGNLSSVACESVLPLKTWRHIVMTADEKQLRIYEDGNLVASTSSSTVTASESDAFWFGTDPTLERRWNGRIDELALFDRALSNEEIASLYRTAQDQISRSQ